MVVEVRNEEDKVVATGNLPAHKSIFVAYVLWFLLGYLGAHRFYLGHVLSACVLLALTVLGVITAWFGIGYFVLWAVGIWLVIDIFLIPSMTREANSVVLVRE